ncbi:MAG TPA: hypothetical protein VIV06_10340, partial [Candidatus Limnocylindrales bacterium]
MAADGVGPQRVREHRLERRAERRVDSELLVDAPPANPPRCPGDAARFVLPKLRLDGLEPAACGGEASGERRGLLLGDAAKTLRALQLGAARHQSLGSLPFLRDGDLECVSGCGETRLRLSPSSLGALGFG